MEGEKLALDLQKVENKAIDELNDRFRASVRKTIKETDWSDIERRLQSMQEAGDVADAVSWQSYDPREYLEQDLFPVASDLMAEHIADVVAKGSSLSFTVTDPNALKWLKEYGAEEIKYLSDSQRQAIKDIVLRGYQDGITYQQQAREIRECIGLDPRRAEVLRKYSENLFAKGKSEAEVWRLMEKKGGALLTQRARTIAIQEATTAGARAFYETTADACKRGILDPNIYEGYRIVTGDERLCEKCSGLAGEARKLPDGSYQSSGSVTPKLHTICRCVEGIRETKGAKKPPSNIDQYIPSTPSTKQLVDNRAEYDQILTRLKNMPSADKRSPAEKDAVNRLNNRLGEIMGSDSRLSRAAHDELVEKSKQYFPKMALKTSDKNGFFDPILFDKAIQNMQRIAVNYPEAIPNKMVLLDIKKGTYAQWDTELKVLRLNVNLVGNKVRSPLTSTTFGELEEVLKKDVAAGFHPKGCDKFEAVVTHELGHALESNLLSKKNIIGKWNEFNAARPTVEGLSEYSKFGNSKGEYHERLAEAFASMHHTPSEQQCEFVHDLTKFLGDLR